MITASTHHFDWIKPTDNVLIVGGGTGKILPYLSSKNIIDYVEKSPKMISIAKKKSIGKNVAFHTMDFRNFTSQKQYEVVVSNFFLDLFTPQEIAQFAKQIHSILAPKGIWLVADFSATNQLKTIKQKCLLKATIIFFNIFARHKLNQVFDIQKIVQHSDFKVIKTTKLNNGMVFASVFKKG
ncbi:MAG: class I SAM-dependent methyltransferase [Flavobacteriales bacterium]|nr:class I SAM-dependent methyltransferase [Flavobacteriales bacterium]